MLVTKWKYVLVILAFIAIALWVVLSKSFFSHQRQGAHSGNYDGRIEKNIASPNEVIEKNKMRADDAAANMNALISDVNEKISHENVVGNNKKAELDALRVRVDHIKESASRDK